MTTKEKILAKALQQFNEEGTEIITTRHIAKALGISQGNLHYHYPTKDMVILMLFQQFLNAYEALLQQEISALKSKAAFQQQLQNKLTVMHTYRFLLKDNALIWRRLPNIKVALLALFEREKDQFVAASKQGLADGLFRKTIDENTLENMANTYLFQLTAWLTAMDYCQQEKDEIQATSELILNHIALHLNKKEAAKWRS